MIGSGIFFKYHPDETFRGKRVLNIGCGFAKFSAKNVTNMDGYDICSPDVVWDLNKTPLPFEDNTFDLILANHILEHVDKWWECFVDMGRILKNGGVIEIWLPGSGNDSQWGYRDHVQMINHYSFFGVQNLSRAGGNAWAKTEQAGGAGNLYLMGQMRNMMDKRWIKWLPRFMKDWACEHLRNVIYEEGYFFIKREQGK